MELILILLFLYILFALFTSLFHVVSGLFPNNKCIKLLKEFIKNFKKEMK
jgi:hypothetical protein